MNTITATLNADSSITLVHMGKTFTVQNVSTYLEAIKYVGIAMEDNYTVGFNLQGAVFTW